VDSRRAESFSDGVFAVAITILVFNLLPIADITKPPLSAGSLAGHWPAYLAYVVSFLTTGITWLNHHSLFTRITNVDRPLLLLNMFLLMGIVAIPFPTALVADHLNDSTAGKVAAVTYGLVMIAISIGYGAIWTYIVAHQQTLRARGDLAMRRASTVRFTAGNAGYVAATLIALVSPVTSVIIYGLLAVYYMFEHLPDPSAESGDAPDD
jgi:TMEM175 potassium channel family protein